MGQRNNFLGQVLQNPEEVNRFLDSLTASCLGQSNPMPTATQPTAENQSRKRQNNVDTNITNISHTFFSSPHTNQIKKSRASDVAQQAQVQHPVVNPTTIRTENNDGLFHQYPPVPVLTYEPNANLYFQAYPSQEMPIFQNTTVTDSYNSMPFSLDSTTSSCPEYVVSANYHGQQFVYHTETAIESTNSNNNNITLSYNCSDNSLAELGGGVNNANINIPLDNNNAQKHKDLPERFSYWRDENWIFERVNDMYTYTHATKSGQRETDIHRIFDIITHDLKHVGIRANLFEISRDKIQLLLPVWAMQDYKKILEDFIILNGRKKLPIKILMGLHQQTHFSLLISKGIYFHVCASLEQATKLQSQLNRTLKHLTGVKNFFTRARKNTVVTFSVANYCANFSKFGKYVCLDTREGFVDADDVLKDPLAMPVLESQQSQTAAQQSSQPLIESENTIYARQPTQESGWFSFTNTNFIPQVDDPTQWVKGSHNISDNNNSSANHPSEISDQSQFAVALDCIDLPPSSFGVEVLDDSLNVSGLYQQNNNNTQNDNTNTPQLTHKDVSDKNKSKRKPIYFECVDLEDDSLGKAIDSGTAMTPAQRYRTRLVNPDSGMKILLTKAEIPTAKETKKVVTQDTYNVRQRRIQEKTRMLDYLERSRQGIFAEVLHTEDAQALMQEQTYMRILSLITEEDVATLQMLLNSLPHPTAIIISIENKRSNSLVNGYGEALKILFDSYGLPFYKLKNEAGKALKDLIEKTRVIMDVRSFGLRYKFNSKSSPSYKFTINDLELYQQCYTLTERIVTTSYNKVSNQHENNAVQLIDPNNNESASEQDDLVGLFTEGHSSLLMPNTNVTHRELFPENRLSQNFYHQTDVELFFSQGENTNAGTQNDEDSLAFLLSSSPNDLR